MKTKLQQKSWFWKRRSRLYIGSDELKGNFSKFKGSIFAVLLGLIIGSILIGATNNNPFVYFHYLLFFAFSSYGYNNWDNTLVWWAIYIVAGLALVLSFKTGMFNIGVAGQMLAAGSVVLAIGIRYDFSQPITVLLAFICGVLAAVFVAAITALLKVFFNVHEVVTSILLNWTIWYFIKWIFTTSKDLYDGSNAATTQVHDNMSLAIGGYKFILPIILALALVVFVWFLLTKTTLGYKVKTVGLNPFAADYAGISRRKYAFISFTLSGGLAGVMAVIYYIGMNPSLSFATDDLPAIGFDSISVALVGQINAFGVIGAAFLWGLIKSGGPIGSVGLGIPNAVSDIIFGVIIYSAACAILLSKLEPIKFLTRYFNVNFNKDKRTKFYAYWKNIWNEWIKTFRIKKTYNQKIRLLKKEIKHLEHEQKKYKNNQINDLKQEYHTKISKLKDNKKQVKILTLELQTKVKEIKSIKNPLIDQQKLEELIQTKQDQVEVSLAQIHQEFNSMKNFLNSEYDKIWTSGKFGINNKAILKKKTLYGENLNEYINSKISYEERIHNLTNSLNNDIRLIKQQSSPLLSVRIKDLKQEYNNQVNFETNTFNKEFNRLINKEKQKIANINKEWKINKLAYKKLKRKEKDKMDALRMILENSSLIFVVLVFGALSGLISERAGVVNIGIEGMMIIGALVFSSFAKNIGGSWGNWSQIIALLCAGLTGVLFAVLHAFASITLKADQIISGVAINILAAAIALFVVQLPSNNGFIAFNTIYQLPKIGSSDFFNIYLLLAVLAIIIIGLGLKHTKWGLRHTAVGENPNAGDAAGINVIKRRYSAVLLSGFLAAIAGGVFTMYASGTFRGVVSGNGFLALAILIFGQWRVGLVTLGAALFAIIQTTAARISYQAGVSSWVVTNKELFNTLPFIMSLLVLVFTSKWSKSPKALGVAFNKAKR